nr:acetylase/deacetylase [Hypoxylon rubiginosum]
MPWLEVSPSHWQRPLGENERMIKWIGDRAHAAGREHWSITVVGSFTLSGSLRDGKLEEKLRKAWMLLRFRHPSIASTAGADTVDYHVPDAKALEQWADETLNVISDSTTTAETLFASFKPSPYITGYFLPHTQQFVLHAAHWRTDGFGALQLLNAFFDALASNLDPAALPWGDEQARLVPSVEEVLELPEKATPEIQAATAGCLRSGALVAGSIGLPYGGDANTKPGGTHSVRRSLSESATASILAACDARNIRPLSAVHASLAAANYAGSASSANGTGHYTSTMRFSLRPYLREPFNSAQYASALYTGSYMAKVAPSNSWQENAAQYNELYAAGLSREFLIARRQFAIQVLEMLSRAGELGPPRSEVDISSVDDAEKLVSPVHHGGKDGGALEVNDVSLGLECLAKETYLFFWIFRGKIEFNLVYNEAFYDKASMEEVVDTTVEALKKGLQV